MLSCNSRYTRLGGTQNYRLSHIETHWPRNDLWEYEFRFNVSHQCVCIWLVNVFVTLLYAVCSSWFPPTFTQPLDQLHAFRICTFRERIFWVPIFNNDHLPYRNTLSRQALHVSLCFILRCFYMAQGEGFEPWTTRYSQWPTRRRSPQFVIV